MGKYIVTLFLIGPILIALVFYLLPILISILKNNQPPYYRNRESYNPYSQHTPPYQNKKSNYRNGYQPRYLLTKNEWYAYKKLREIAEAKDLQVCPKVRMLDIIEPRRGERNYRTLFWKIQAKHVDFLICDKDLHIQAIVELDDNSHNTKERKERDIFVDDILTSVGYKVIRTHYITENTLDSLTQSKTNKTRSEI